MPDEEASADQEEVKQDTPEQGGSEETPAEDAPEVDWEQRYNDLRPEADRWRTSADQYEEFFDNPSPEGLATLMAQLEPHERDAVIGRVGYQLEKDEEEYEDEYDEESDAEERLEQIESYLAQGAEQAQIEEFQEQEADYVSEEIAALEAQEGREFSEREIQILFLNATHPNLRGDRGEPDVEAAYDALREANEAERQRVVDSKRAPQAPSGASPSQQVDLDDPEQRRDWMARRLTESQ
jgi:hypothetical protein